MKPLWKVTLYWSYMPLAFYGLVKPSKRVVVYRSRWFANLRAFFWSIPAIGTFASNWATVEAYWPDSNVVPLRKEAA